MWRRDGAELFFRNTGGDMYAVTVGEGPAVRARPPQAPVLPAGHGPAELYRSYDVHPDGKRFLMLSAGGAEARGLNVIFDWQP